MESSRMGCFHGARLHIDGVNVALLSENSVAQFLGPTALKQLSSSSLYADSSIRQEVAVSVVGEYI
jgi:hypothetical protein